jgi:hypothetical protein
MSGTDNHILINKLDEFIRKYYKNQLVKGALYSTGLLITAYLLVVLLEYLGEFNILMRSVLFYSFLSLSLFVIVKFIAIPLLKLKRYGKVISYEEAAQIIGTHFGSVQDKLLNVLQLQSERSLTGSDELLMAGINQKINELKPVPFSSAINISDNKRYLKYVLPPVFLTIGIALIWPHILTKSTTRLVHHATYFESEAPFTFNIQNNELKAMQQQDFTLQVKLNGSEIPNEVFIKIDGSEFKLEKENNITFNYTFKNLQQSKEFQLMGAGYNSTEYTLEVLPKPSLMQFSVKLKYPAYLNRKDEVINNSGDLQVPQGTKIQWDFNTKNTNFLMLGFADTTFNLNESAKDKFTFAKFMMYSTGYYIKTKNPYVKTYGDSVNYGINVLADQVPYIDAAEKQDSTNFKNIYFSGTIKDDYGFNKLLFRYTHYSSDSLGNNSQKSGENFLNISKSQIAQSYYYYFDANLFDLKPGDKIEYYFEVWDNDGVNGSKPARSKVMSFKAPTIDELNEATGKNNEEIKKDLDESIKKAKELQKDINELSKKVNDKKQLGWEEKKKIEDILNKQKNLDNKVNEVKQENQMNNQQQNEFNQQDESLLEKQKQLEQLFENVMTPEMKKLFDELQKMMDQMDRNQIQQKLEEMKLSNKDIEKELDRALETFKQFEVEQKLQQAIDKMEELIKKEEQLNKETEGRKETKGTEEKKETKGTDNKKDDLKGDQKKDDAKGDDKKDDAKSEDSKNKDSKDQNSKDNKSGDDKNKKSPDSKELKNKQEQIEKEFDKVKEELKELEQKNSELEQPNKMPDTKQEQQKASEEMQKSSEQLEKNQKNSASKSQKEAKKSMEEMKDKMESAMEEMEEKEEEESTNDLRQILENLLNLSFAQEELIKTLPKTRIDNPQYTKIPQMQKKLQDDSKIIEDSLFALSKQAPQITAFVNREISSINHNMQKTVQALAERIPSEAGMRMQSSLTSINNLAAMLSEELEKMQEQQKQKNKMKSSGGGKCKKCKNPQGSDGKKPKSGNPSMSSMQKQLNDQLKQLKEALEKGQKPGEKPGQKPGEKPGQKPGGMGMGQQQGQNPMYQQPGMSEQLAKMAAQQEAIRRQIQQMMDEMKNKGQTPGGNLADLMEQTEKDIVNKQISNETLKRQQDILTRLLESEKAEREREQDEKRKSNEAKSEVLSNPERFLEYKRMKQKELELLNTVPPSLTPFYKEKVNNYFNSVSK